MNTEIITLISLLVVRLGMPLLIMLGISYVLSRWDERRAAQGDWFNGPSLSS